MELRIFDHVKAEKEKAIAMFNRFRRILKLWRSFQVLAVLGLIWLSVRLPAVLNSSNVFNHHLVFLLGNAIIVSLFVNFRKNDDVYLSTCREFYDERVKYCDVAHQTDSSLPPTLAEELDCNNELNQNFAATERTAAISQSDDVMAAIEKATRQINRFQRTQSEKLKQELVLPQLPRSETDSSRKTSSPSDAAEMEALSNEEFRRRVDAFINNHWSHANAKANRYKYH
ncbi:uncharacterized protein LOC127265238 [Andrographis paniculata]|uniref:uncharacterized protein LOC127265238 n=1 Tax=Andrographis paniculata TaxID=175694 RepID=UPI0021E7C916|nr:uncharacterized protein LOC127265238 [Andrographis paniculata]